MQSTRPFPRAARTTVASPSSREHVRQDPDPGPVAATITRPATGYGLVAICIPTYKRPANLAALLNSLLALENEGFGIHVIVVDNDDTQSARPIVSSILGNTLTPFTYDCAGNRNLPIARNRLVELGSAIGADWIWFLDDDQIVEPDALKHLLATANRYDVDCVVPRVRYEFDGVSSSWAQWSGIFDEVQRPTGRPAKRFGTNGPLCRVSSVSAVEQPFDPTLKFVGGHHGGEDGHFFARFHANNFRSIGCDDAVVHDRVHSSRNNPHWLTHRALRIGLVKGFLIREVKPSHMKSAGFLMAGLGYSVGNALMTLINLPLGPSRFFRPWIRAVQGYGVVVGVLSGRRFLRGKDPAQIHGR